MTTGAADSGSQCQQIIHLDTRGREHFNEAQLAVGDGAGFIDDYRIDARQLF